MNISTLTFCLFSTLLTFCFLLCQPPIAAAIDSVSPSSLSPIPRKPSDLKPGLVRPGSKVPQTKKILKGKKSSKPGKSAVLPRVSSTTASPPVSTTPASCVYHFQCGLSAICLSGSCFQPECKANHHCLGRGVYYKCLRARCVPARQRACRRDLECSRNFFFGKKCRNYRCV